MYKFIYVIYFSLFVRLFNINLLKYADSLLGPEILGYIRQYPFLCE